ncbi:MAG: SDR family oxidoreductase [Halieaceae bacterium]|nr:SDR family oxidoreductase [Halieaceae bacterium]
MMTELKTGVVVTGGASGIGLASAKMLAESGRPVAIWDLDTEKSQRAAADIVSRYDVLALGLGVDVRNNDAIRDAAAKTRAVLPAIGGLVHAAGIVLVTGISDVTEENWAAVLDVNLRAQVLIVKEFLEDFKQCPGAAIVGIASMNATLGNGMIPAYSASKGGMLSLTRSMSDELGRHGIRINAVSPGMIATQMLLNSVDEVALDRFSQTTHLGRLGEPEEIGAVVKFLLSSEASYITGTELVVDGGAIPSQRS